MPRTLKTGLPQRRPLVLHSASDVRPWTHDYVSLQPPPNPGGVPTFLRLLQVGKHMQDRLTQTPTREGTVLYESVAAQTPMTLAALSSLEEDATDLALALGHADAALADAAAAHAAELERQREAHGAELSRVCEAAAEDRREDSARLQAAVDNLQAQLADRDDVIRQLTDQLMATEEPAVDSPDSEAEEEEVSRRSSSSAADTTPSADEAEPARLFEEPGAASVSIRRLVEAESFGGGSAGSEGGASRSARRVGAASVVARIELLRAERELQRANEVRRSAEARLQEEQRGVSRERARVARAREEAEEWAARTAVVAEAQEALHEVAGKEVRARCAAWPFAAVQREPSGSPVEAPAAQPAPSDSAGDAVAASQTGASEASAGGPHAAAQTQGGVTPEDCRAHGFAQLKRGTFRRPSAVQKVKMRSALKPSFRSCRDETPLFTLEFTNYDKSLFEPAGDSAAGSDGSPRRPRPRSAQVVRSSTVCGKPLFQRRSHLLCSPVSAAYG